MNADALIQQVIDVNAEMAALKAKKAALVAQFPAGRTEGDTLAIYVGADSTHSRIDVARLRTYVSEHVLKLCRVTQRVKGSAKIVPKLKPKEKKHAASAL